MLWYNRIEIYGELRMKNCRDSFIEILNNHLNDKPTEIIEVDKEELFRIAQEQQMSAIVAFQYKTATWTESFRSSYYSTIAQYANRNKIIESIKKAFSERNIVSAQCSCVPTKNELPEGG